MLSNGIIRTSADSPTRRVVPEAACSRAHERAVPVERGRSQTGRAGRRPTQELEDPPQDPLLPHRATGLVEAVLILILVG